MWHKLCHIRSGDNRGKKKVKGVVGVPWVAAVPCPGLGEELRAPRARLPSVTPRVTLWGHACHQAGAGRDSHIAARLILHSL